jgi:hypothetical protein
MHTNKILIFKITYFSFKVIFYLFIFCIFVRPCLQDPFFLKIKLNKIDLKGICQTYP